MGDPAKQEEDLFTRNYLDHNQCVSEGFIPPSYEYNNCRYKLEDQHELKNQMQSIPLALA